MEHATGGEEVHAAAHRKEDGAGGGEVERPAHPGSAAARHTSPEYLRGARLVPGGAADATARAFMTTGEEGSKGRL